jgi:hypothetical protein
LLSASIALQLIQANGDTYWMGRVDTIELGYGFSLGEGDWNPWTLTDGSECLIPAYIDVRRKGENWVRFGSFYPASNKAELSSSSR